MISCEQFQLPQGKILEWSESEI